MMKSTRFAPVSFVVLCLLSLFTLSAQVGINTTTPRTTLEVGGDAIISETLDINNFSSLTANEDSTFLVQDSNNDLKSLDVSNPTGAALAYIQEYQITNPEEDWVLDFDTGVDASDFVLIAISAHFDLELNTSSSAGASDNASLPYTATFIKNGTWHIIADSQWLRTWIQLKLEPGP